MDVHENIGSPLLHPVLWEAAEIRSGRVGHPDARVVMDWLDQFIVVSHPALGRTGEVCPYVSPALRAKALWLSVAPNAAKSEDEACRLLRLYLATYESNLYTAHGANDLKTFVIVCPGLSPKAVPAFIRAVHSAIKPEFVERGLMLGEFFPEHESAGVHNPHFRPLRSPVPLFVIRRMVAGDLVFLNNASDPPHRTVLYLRAYLRTFHGRLSAERIDEAERAIEAARRQAEFIN